MSVDRPLSPQNERPQISAGRESAEMQDRSLGELLRDINHEISLVQSDIERGASTSGVGRRLQRIELLSRRAQKSASRNPAGAEHHFSDEKDEAASVTTVAAKKAATSDEASGDQQAELIALLQQTLAALYVGDAQHSEDGSLNQADDLLAIRNRFETDLAQIEAAFEDERRELIESVESTAFERNRLLTQLVQANNRLADFTRDYISMTARAESAEALSRAAMSSLSWKLTAPLRLANRLTGRLFGQMRHPRKFALRIWRSLKRRTGKGWSAGAKAWHAAMSWIFRPLRIAFDYLAALLWPEPKKRAPKKTTTLFPPSGLPHDKWLQEFRRLNGRNLRVLHIGNIANNAYNNAKIQRQRGIDADALSFDYYHIMACPEWEDGAPKKPIKDDMFPDWWRAGLRPGYRRPRWFVQGPLDICVRYLLAQTVRAPSRRFLWRWMTFERWMLCHPSRWTERIRNEVLKRTDRIIQYDAGPANGIMWSWLGKEFQDWSKDNAGKWPRLARKVGASGRRLAAFGRTADIGKGLIRHLDRTQGQRAKTRARLEALLETPGDAPSVDWHFNWWYHPYMKLLLRRYDVVQAYATQTAIPFMFSHAYIAYEHGTIRSIPFQDTDEGRICMATYRAADAVFVTNTDNLESARKMNLSEERTVALPHAFDSDKLVRHMQRSKKSPPPGQAILFTPSRQHWVGADPGWAKGNDLVFHALRQVRDSGRFCRLQAIEWGAHIDESKKLIEELGIADMVEWLPKMGKRELWDAYLQSHAVIDQFQTPALGGVTFEALMLGRRVLTAIDEAEMTKFFGSTPPLYNCRSIDDIAKAMIRVIDDLEDDGRDGEKNHLWMQEKHSADTIVKIQVDRYGEVLSEPD